MTKSSLLIAVLFTLAAGHALAQAESEKENAKEQKQGTLKPEDKPAPMVKVVPAAKSKHAKPRKVTSAKPRNARPQGARPARNPRPSGRPVRPGSGRN